MALAESAHSSSLSDIYNNPNASEEHVLALNYINTIKEFQSLSPELQAEKLRELELRQPKK